MDVDETWSELTPAAAPLVEAEISMEAAEIDSDLSAAEIMSDPRLASMLDHKNMPFDGKRMFFGGFKVAVSLRN